MPEYWSGYSLSLLQQIFPTQESNRGLLHCRRVLYQLSYQRRRERLYPLQHSGLENSIDCIVCGVAKSPTGLRDFHFNFSLSRDCHSLIFSCSKTRCQPRKWNWDKSTREKITRSLLCKCQCNSDLRGWGPSRLLIIFYEAWWRSSCGAGSEISGYFILIWFAKDWIPGD